MLQWYNHEMDTANIILHRIAHCLGQMLEAKAEVEAKILASGP